MSDTSKKSCAVMLFRFQKQKSRVSGPGLVSPSPLSEMNLKTNHCTCRIEQATQAMLKFAYWESSCFKAQYLHRRRIMTSRGKRLKSSAVTQSTVFAKLFIRAKRGRKLSFVPTQCNARHSTKNARGRMRIEIAMKH